MTHSSWYVFFHPCAAAAKLEQLEEQAAATDSLQDELNEMKMEADKRADLMAQLQAQNEELLNVNQELERHVKELSRLNTDLSGRLEAANVSINDLHEELNRRRDAASQLEEVDKLLYRFENMKENYEKRIRTLRDMVKQLKKERKSDESYARELEVIDMTPDNNTSTTHSDDPSFGLNEELSRREKARQTPPAPKRPPIDWLRTPLD